LKTTDNFQDKKSVLVFSENPQIALELLAAARPLSEVLGCGLILLVVRGSNDNTYQEEIERGADEVLAFQLSGDVTSSTEIFAEALSSVIQLKNPEIILVGAIRVDTDVISRVSQRLRKPCASGCIGLQIGISRELIIDRRVYGGRFVANQILNKSPKIATVQPGRFEPLPREKNRPGKVTYHTLPIRPSKMNVTSSIERERSAVDIVKSDIVVAAGRGVGSKEGLGLVDSLADCLGGAIAGSRPITDDWRWLPSDRKIGLSGRTVKPRLYIACGISGQTEHVVGHRSARIVVAINSDPDAPIHLETDYQVIADLHQILPVLIKRLLKSEALI
jgi:electron transfer flavoprotein alpha subunit